MTRQINISNEVAKICDEYRRRNRHWSYSDIFLFLSSMDRDQDMVRFKINEIFDQLRGEFPDLDDNSINTIQLLTLKVMKLDPNKLGLALEGLKQFIRDLDKIPLRK